MGACNSRLDRKEAVSRCKGRRRYTKQLVQARRDFATAHSLYMRALRCTGSALLQFATAESNSIPLPVPPSPPPPPPPPISPSPVPPSPSPPPLSPLTSKWTSSVSNSPILPPPPPPMAAGSGWDFWDPFMPNSSRSGTDGEWEEEECINAGTATVHAAAVPPPPVVRRYEKDLTRELAMVVVPRGKKDISEIVKELDEYFLKAAEAGNRVSGILEAPNCDFVISNQGVTGKMLGYGKNLNPMGFMWGSNSNSNLKPDVFTRYSNGGGTLGISHASTVEKLYAWEKKLYLEVKSYEKVKEEHEKKVEALRKQEVKGGDYLKIEKNKLEIERLESKMLVGAQAIETTTSEIISLREAELFPQLLDLLTGLTSMWRGMYECHQVQTHIVQHLQHLNLPKTDPNPNPTSNPLCEATLQLELEADRWFTAFSSLIKSQRDYIYSLTGWLRLSLFGSHQQNHHLHEPLSEIYSLCEEWQLAIDRIPDKVASEGIKSFLMMVRAVAAQQGEEIKQKKRADAAFREFEKKSDELRSAEARHGPLSERRAKVDGLKVKAEEERSKYQKSVGVTRAVTLNNFQTALPNVFQAMTGFSGICVQAFEAVYSRLSSGSGDCVLDDKRLLT
ncbi:hypothetical protein LUZ63_009774 [Rhynchospora breviuscula]|uniref:DUF632 domain-containing protein n=1 Tax=Rhynchospora breviuscula TaxID=2022672 RepID=A0A9Q0CFN7_9POAL|nr:hypothetical protein LUZ63_009774 [Rhynchospora breviuscula]